MRRKKFIASLLATASIPVLGNAFERTNLARTGKAFIANAGEGRIHGHIKLKGVNQNIIDVKVSGSDTDGQLAIFEQTSISQGKGTPLHVHHSQDEIFHVLEGEYQFKVGEDQFRLKAGDSVFLPMKVPHAWTQTSARGKMTVTLQPAGKLENFFVSVAALDHEPTHEEMAKLFADNEMQVIGPPLKLE